MLAGETGEWLHAKLRNGHAGAPTGGSFLDECLRRLPTCASPVQSGAASGGLDRDERLRRGEAPIFHLAVWDST